jgi:hypothetical protein
MYLLTQLVKKSTSCSVPIISCLFTILITNSVEQKLTATQLVKKFSALYGNRRFIAVFRTVRHWYLS